ncbi:hypothetical protein ACFLXB_08235 [Chloroflexota bacterium]
MEEINYINKFGYFEEIPEDFRKVFMWLCQDIASLKQKWETYLGLFSTTDATDILSDSASGIFQMFEETLRNDITMLICRLSDPPETSGHKNLSMSFLLNEVGVNKEITHYFTRFEEACEGIRTIRHKNVGHNDLETRLKPIDNPLPNINRKHIDLTIYLAEQLLNKVVNIYCEVELNFSLSYRGGPDHLLGVLLRGINYTNWNETEHRISQNDTE